MAQLPVNTMRSAHDKDLPYFFFIGHNNNLALSRFVLSGQLFNGENLNVPAPAPPLPSPILYVPALCQAILIKNGP